MDIAPYGTWKSPITSDLIVSESITIGQTALDGDDVCWTEMRPEEGGRYVVVRRRPDGTAHDVTPPPFNARTRVHEYGGGAYAVDGGTLYFANFADQRLYRQERGGEPQPLTPAAAYRYADYCIDRARNSVICVREDHTGEGEARNAIVRIATDANGADAGSLLAEGNDFYSSPRVSPDGKRLAWLTWNHPNMPWDGTELWVAAMRNDGSLGERRLVAGGAAESIFQPEWSPDGVLHFVSDRSGWWNLYRDDAGAVEPLCAMEAEFGRPHWVFGMSAYAFASGGRIVCTYSQQGIGRLAVLDPASRALTPLDLPFTSYGEVRASGDTVVIVAGSGTAMPCVVRLDLASGRSEVLRRSSEIDIDPGYLSRPEPIEFPTEGGVTAHAIYYAPANKDYRAPDGEKPPLIVKIHGGPTSAATATLSLGIQYWTSRGFAVVDVNYGGSTGYGRAYRERLNGNWGIVDVDDCANAARFLVERGDADGKRLIITGGSAGGYTTLAALTFRNVFSAGASHFGVSDTEVLAKETHKFESRYLDQLIGPYPERADLYRERSPLHHAERLNVPVIFFQGLEDAIVPPDQAEMMVDALRRRRVPVAYVPFEGEQHGFRKAANIKRALEAELYFYGRVFGFEPADAIEPVLIENL